MDLNFISGIRFIGFVNGLKEGYDHLWEINSSYITENSIIWSYSCSHTCLIFSCALSISMQNSLSPITTKVNVYKYNYPFDYYAFLAHKVILFYIT